MKICRTVYALYCILSKWLRQSIDTSQQRNKYSSNYFIDFQWHIFLDFCINWFEYDTREIHLKWNSHSKPTGNSFLHLGWHHIVGIQAMRSLYEWTQSKLVFSIPCASTQRKCYLDNIFNPTLEFIRLRKSGNSFHAAKASSFWVKLRLTKSLQPFGSFKQISGWTFSTNL